jgi:hypothetical protein
MTKKIPSLMVFFSFPLLNLSSCLTTYICSVFITPKSNLTLNNVWLLALCLVYSLDGFYLNFNKLVCSGLVSSFLVPEVFL